MSLGYNVIKFVHVTAVIVWLGGLVTLTLLGARLARASDPTAIRLFGEQSTFFGRKVQNPAAVIALLAGLVLMGMLKTMTFWLGWGLVALIVSLGLDGAVLRRATRELTEIAAAASPDADRLEALRRRIQLGAWLNIAILVSTVFVMIVKPALK